MKSIGLRALARSRKAPTETTLVTRDYGRDVIGLFVPIDRLAELDARALLAAEAPANQEGSKK